MNCPKCNSEIKRKCKVCGFTPEKKPQKEKKEKIEKSESEIVGAYVDKIIKNYGYHGRNGVAYDKSIQKNIWQDNDFFVSIVFQTNEQKYEFLKQSGWVVEEEGQIQIVNGLKLAEKLGIQLKIEKRVEYPQGDLELRSLVMDMEE